MNHRPIVFVDIETTGGKAQNSRIIDIGAIRVENGIVVKRMNQLVNPEQPVPRYITKLTGITNQMVWSAPTFKAIASELEDILHGALFVAHYVKFDYSFIKHEFEMIGLKYNSDRACTVKLSRITHPEQKRHGLDFVIQRMNLDVINRHRGMDDAEVLVKFFASEMSLNAASTLSKLSDCTTTTTKVTRVHVNQTKLSL